MLFASIVLISFVIRNDASAMNRIEQCSDYKLHMLLPTEDVPLNIRLQTEKTTGYEGHFSGLTPQSYGLNITFRSHVDYEVLTEIIAEVKQPTSRLMINVPNITSPNSFVFKLNGLSDGNWFQEQTCIKKATFLPNQHLLVIDLTGELRQNSQCALRFGGFHSQAYNTKRFKGTKGLRLSVDEGSGVVSAGSAAVYTAFLMRNAHSVFPCFDHPALKARFSLCLAFPSDLTVASSTPPSHTFFEPSDNGTKTVCFLPTPPISPHSLTFALMRNYEEYDDTNSQTSVFAPYAIEGSTKWILREAELALEHIRQLTGVAYPFPKIQFLIVDNPPPSTHGSFGLSVLSATLMGRSQQYTGNVAKLYHSIVHQWLGGLVTIRNWNEICLQEGLTYILEWMFQDEHAPGALMEEIQEANRIGFQQTPKSLMNLVNDTDTIPVECASVAPVIFYDATQQLEPGFLRTFVQRLLAEHKFGNAGLNEWSDLIWETVPSRPLTLTANLRHWFENSEPLIVYLQDKLTNYTITVDDDSARRFTFRTVLGLVYCSSDKEPHAVITSFFGTAVSISNRTAWCVFDPDGLTLTYKVYDVFTYKRVLAYDRVDTFEHLTDRRLDKFADDFCLALLKNLIWQSVSSDRLPWLDVFDLVKYRLDANRNFVCMCCITEPRLRNAACGLIRQKCAYLQLIKNVFV